MLKDDHQDLLNRIAIMIQFYQTEKEKAEDVTSYTEIQIALDTLNDAYFYLQTFFGLHTVFKILK